MIWCTAWQSINLRLLSMRDAKCQFQLSYVPLRDNLCTVFLSTYLNIYAMERFSVHIIYLHWSSWGLDTHMGAVYGAYDIGEASGRSLS